MQKLKLSTLKLTENMKETLKKYTDDKKTISTLYKNMLLLTYNPVKGAGLKTLKKFYFDGYKVKYYNYETLTERELQLFKEINKNL